MADSRTRPRPKKSRKSSRSRWRTASTSDIHDLYERSVQEPAAECQFIVEVWKARRSRKPRTIREDFCGTAAVAMEWTKFGRENESWCVDLDASVLDWAARKIPVRLKPAQRSRLHLIRGDVRTAKTPPVDTLLALNFSYYLFKTRDAMRRYFRIVHRNLVRDGIFIADAYGGTESFAEMEEEKNLDGFTYVWDQHRYNPITGDALNYIHFRFPDGSKIRRAFTYDWRLWTLPELQEILLEAGFRSASIWWEGTDRKGDGNGVFKPATEGDACSGWIAYVVAEK